MLHDTNYIEIIKGVIKRVVYQYSPKNVDILVNNSTDLYNQFLSVQTPESLQTLNPEINPELFLDTLLMEIRGATIKYCSEKKKRRKLNEQLLMSDIELLEKQVQNNPDINEEVLNEIN